MSARVGTNGFGHRLLGPVPDGSMTDLVALLRGKPSVQDDDEVFKVRATS